MDKYLHPVTLGAVLPGAGTERRERAIAESIVAAACGNAEAALVFAPVLDSPRPFFHTRRAQGGGMALRAPKPALTIALMVAVFGASPAVAGDEITGSCGNLVTTPYNRNPAFCAPEGTRGQGLKINIDGVMTDIPDTRCGCLPIALRYDNPGVLKTPGAGPWAGQIDKDAKGHAVFDSVASGIGAWALWFQRFVERRRARGEAVTAFRIIAQYAPPDDCVGSVGTPPDCPYGVNPTRVYAERIARAVGKGADDELNLDPNDCREGREAVYSVFTEIATMEIGRNFCSRASDDRCIFDRDLFDGAVDQVFGPVNYGPCADPPEAHGEPDETAAPSAARADGD